MSSSSPPQQLEPEASRVLDFWFTGDSSTYARWFKQSDTFDDELRTQFQPLVQRARASSLDSWKTSAKGTLALLILLDQVPRNIYRNSGESFASDQQARDIAVDAIARGLDRSEELTIIERSFFYLPLMHDENMISQIACLAYFEGLEARCHGYVSKEDVAKDGCEREVVDEGLRAYMTGGVDMAKRHIQAILRFGRFPGRNVALGRESSEEEKVFVEEHPLGF